MKRLLVTTLILLALCLPFVAMQRVSAKNIFQDACSNGSAQANSSVCTANGNDNPISGPNGLIIKIAKLIGLITGIASVIMIIVSGARMVTSGGDSNSVATARRTLLYSVVGLIIAILAPVILSFILSNI